MLLLTCCLPTLHFECEFNEKHFDKPNKTCRARGVSSSLNSRAIKEDEQQTKTKGSKVVIKKNLICQSQQFLKKKANVISNKCLVKRWKTLSSLDKME